MNIGYVYLSFHKGKSLPVISSDAFSYKEHIVIVDFITGLDKRLNHDEVDAKVNKTFLSVLRALFFRTLDEEYGFVIQSKANTMPAFLEHTYNWLVSNQHILSGGVREFVMESLYLQEYCPADSGKTLFDDSQHIVVEKRKSEMFGPGYILKTVKCGVRFNHEKEYFIKKAKVIISG